MAELIAVMGESGSGKTTAARTLDPRTTYYIDCDKKGLSWKGWKSQYNETAKNYIRNSDAEYIDKIIRGINEKAKQIKTVVIDTVNGIMIDEEFKRMKEKGYDKWQDLAASVYGLISNCQNYREDMTIFFLFHVADITDDMGNHQYHILTSGRKLEKIKLESKFTTVLLAKRIDGNNVFETQSKNSTAKSPMGLFENFEIPNDLNAVVNAINEYNRG